MRHRSHGVLSVVEAFHGSENPFPRSRGTPTRCEGPLFRVPEGSLVKMEVVWFIAFYCRRADVIQAGGERSLQPALSFWGASSYRAVS
jgi:hypothetical protein